MKNMNRNINLHINNAEYCVCCGEIIPEGRQVCSKCEYKFMNNREDVDEDYEDWDDEIYNN